MKIIYKVIPLFLTVFALCTSCRRQEPVIINEASSPVLHEEKTAQEIIESNEYLASDFWQDHPFVLIEGEKITLRYSKRDDVEKLLGTPQIIQFHEHGGEEYYWWNFWTCSYGQDTLRFNYDQDGNVIRISANAEYYGEVQFLGKNIKSLTIGNILQLVSSLEVNIYDGTTGGTIMFDYKLSPKVQIDYSFWFYSTGSNTGRIRWIDMYYPWSWDEES